MTLGIKEYPQLMETVMYTPQNTQDAMTSTGVSHGIAVVIVVLN